MHQYIKVSGTPYERGFQYGSQAKERIYKVIEEYKVLFEKEAFITWDKAYELSKPYRKEISIRSSRLIVAPKSCLLRQILPKTRAQRSACRLKLARTGIHC